MNRYQTSTPRAAFSIAAAALTAMTIGLAVVLPAKMDAASHGKRALASVRAVAPVVTTGSIVPARIEAQGVREPDLASAPAGSSGGERDARG